MLLLVAVTSSSLSYYTEEQLIGVIIDLFIAGAETTSNSIGINMI
jgi:cytochrome P450